jgi:hypothetical protein
MGGAEGDTPSNARIHILKPRPANLVVLLVNGQVDIVERSLLLELVRGREPREPRADTDDAQLAGSKWSILLQTGVGIPLAGLGNLPWPAAQHESCAHWRGSHGERADRLAVQSISAC